MALDLSLKWWLSWPSSSAASTKWASRITDAPTPRARRSASRTASAPCTPSPSTTFWVDGGLKEKRLDESGATWPRPSLADTRAGPLIYSSQNGYDGLAQLFHVGSSHAGDVDASGTHDINGVVLLQFLHLIFGQTRKTEHAVLSFNERKVLLGPGLFETSDKG